MSDNICYFFEKKLISLSKTCNRVSLWFRELVRLDIHATEWLIYAGSHISVCEDKVQKLQNACYNLNYKDTPILNLFSNPILLTLAMPINKKKKKRKKINPCFLTFYHLVRQRGLNIETQRVSSYK